MKLAIWLMSLLFLQIQTPHLLASGFPSQSLYQVPAIWTTDQGNKVKLSDWKDKEVIISMVYTSCSGACPLIIKKVKKVEALFKAQQRPVSVILVTFDPERDTPESLKKYREKIELKDLHWTFLSGKSADVRRLSMLLGIRYSKQNSGEFMHDNKIVLLSKDGVISRSINDLEEDEATLVTQDK